MSRRTSKCTGVNHFILSTSRSSKVHDCHSLEDPFHVPSTAKNHNSTRSSIFAVDQQPELARQMFFYAQLHFLDKCKHNGLHLKGGRRRKAQIELEQRAPNSVFHPGRLIRTSSLHVSPMYSGSYSDFIGCASFFESGVREPNNCDLVTLPSYTQGADVHISNEMFANARTGLFPERPITHTKSYPCFQMSYQGKLSLFPFIVSKQNSFQHENTALCTIF